MCADLSMVSANADNCLDWGLAPTVYTLSRGRTSGPLTGETQGVALASQVPVLAELHPSSLVMGDSLKVTPREYLVSWFDFN